MADEKAGADQVLKERVQELLDTAINPAVAGHGGYIELIDVKDSTAYIRMAGGCQGCGAMAGLPARSDPGGTRSRSEYWTGSTWSSSPSAATKSSIPP